MTEGDTYAFCQLQCDDAENIEECIRKCMNEQSTLAEAYYYEEVDVCDILPECCEMCEEECYDISMEHDGFCSGDDCIDMDCFWRCMEDCKNNPPV